MRKPLLFLLSILVASTLACGLGGSAEEPTPEPPTAEPTAEPPAEPTPEPTEEPEAEEPAEEPAADFESGALWRVGGESGVFDNEFAALGGMAVDADGNVYIADNIHGVYVYSPSGELVRSFAADDTNNATDVAIADDGTIFVAAWGSSAIFAYDAEGTLITQWGSEGNGEGQFGTFAPDALDVGPDGNVYVLDSNETDAEEDFVRVQVFSPSGDYLQEFPVEDDFFSPTDMAFGPDGRLYIAGFLGGSLQVYSTDGTLEETIAEEALSGSGLQNITFDDAGNIYAATWTPSGVVKLDPAGNELERYGFESDETSSGWPEGGFYQPKGVAVAADGSAIYVSDWGADYSYVTALDAANPVTTGPATPPEDASSDAPEGIVWASSATATSSYGEDSYAPSQATGAPNVDGCSDDPNAWASETASQEETLTLTYDTLIIPTQVVIYQNYSPGAITQVDLTDENGTVTTVYTAEAELIDECPYVLTIDVSGVEAPVTTVTISLDEGPISNWSEIDAVGLIGQ